MSCDDCKRVQDEGSIAYYRIEAANVGVVGCDKHVGVVFLALMKLQREGISKHARYARQIFRMKGRPEEPEPAKIKFNISSKDD